MRCYDSLLATTSIFDETSTSSITHHSLPLTTYHSPLTTNHKPKSPGTSRHPGSIKPSDCQGLLEQLGLIHQIDVGALEACPGLGALVIDGVDEAVPVFLIDKILVHAVVEARITGLLTELNVLHVSFGCQDTMIVFPGPQQFMQVLGTHLQ